MLPVLQIGPLSLPTAAFLLLIGFWLGLDLTEKHAPRFGAVPAAMYNLLLAAVIAGIIGARLGYAAQSPGAFLQSPLSLLALTPQMLDPAWGMAAAVLAGLVMVRIKEMPLWTTLDALTSLLSVLAVTLGLAHFASGEAFGSATRQPWAIFLWGEMRHPTQVYETIAALLIAAAVWPSAHAAYLSSTRPGFRFWLFLALSAGARMLLETFRGDSQTAAGFRLAQLIAWVLLALSLWQMGRRLSASTAAVTTTQEG
jgi:prolipoprotein diacylglyceryltransferase